MDRVIEKKRWTLKKIAAISLGGIFILFVLYSLIFANHDSKLNVQAERLTIAEVEQGFYLDYVPANGTVMPLKTVYMDAVEGGQVDTLYVEEGAFLKKGEPILRLTNTNLLLDIMYREAELFQQINNLRNTRLMMQQNELDIRSTLLNLDHQIASQKRLFEKNRELKENHLVSEIEYEESRDQYKYLVDRRELTLENHKIDSTFRIVQIEQLEASVTRMQGNLEIIKGRQDRLTLRAPITGHLTSLDAEIGQSKGRGQRIGQIDRLDGFKVRATIDEHYIARVANGLRGEFEFAHKTYAMKIVKVYPEVLDGRFEFDMEFDGEEPDGIRRGQTVRIRLELGNPSPALLIPRGGFFQSTGGNWIYVMSADGSYASKREIKIARQNNQHYEVVEGLEPGERVITSSYETYGDVDRLVLKH